MGDKIDLSHKVWEYHKTFERFIEKKSFGALSHLITPTIVYSSKEEVKKQLGIINRNKIDWFLGILGNSSWPSCNYQNLFSHLNVLNPNWTKNHSLHYSFFWVQWSSGLDMRKKKLETCRNIYKSRKWPKKSTK